MISERELKLIQLLIPINYYFHYNNNGFFFQKKGKSLRWESKIDGFIDWLKLINGIRERYWWENDNYLNKYI